MRRPRGDQGGFPDLYGKSTNPPIDSSPLRPILHPAGRYFKKPLTAASRGIGTVLPACPARIGPIVHPWLKGPIRTFPKRPPRLAVLFERWIAEHGDDPSRYFQASNKAGACGSER